MWKPTYCNIYWHNKSWVFFFLFETIDDNLICSLTVTLTDCLWLKNISISSSPWPRPGRPGTAFKQCGERQVVSQTTVPNSVSRSSHSLSWKETSWWVWVKDSKKKTKEGAPHPPPHCVYTCAHKGLYKGVEQPTPMYKYPWCCWWRREKGQSESAYHSSSFSLSFPSVHLFFSFFLLQLYMCNCFCYHVSFHRENTEDFTWQANYDL